MSHSIALLKDGSVYTWGSNSQGQLGVGPHVMESDVPLKVDDLASITAVAAGYNFSLALRENGKVCVWGGGDTIWNYSPSLVVGLSNVVAIAAGQKDALALTREGEVWQWAVGYTPRKVAGLRSVTAIAVGGAHFMALTCSGEVWTWGANWKGQLGNGAGVEDPIPAQVLGLQNVVHIAAGFSHSMAITEDGSLYTWGSNAKGELGDGTFTDKAKAAKVEGLTNVSQAVGGDMSSMVTTEDGRLYIWGNGAYAQLGTLGVRTDWPTPTEMKVENSILEIASGARHNFYVTEDGDLYAWGRNTSKQLGFAANEDSDAPGRVLSGLLTGLTYSVVRVVGASAWAQTELTALNGMSVVKPIFWDFYLRNITRAELAAILVGVYEKTGGAAPVTPRRGSFEDVAGHLLEDDVYKARALGFVDGVGAGLFCPDKEVTRQEAAKMFALWAAKKQAATLHLDAAPALSYADVENMDAWALPYVAFATEVGLMGGASGLFLPRAYMTKEQALAIVYRAIQRFGWAPKPGRVP